MLRPTQQLLFRPLAALARFNIHQPLPLNPRESKVLLNLLTSSFRQHLDREHSKEWGRPDTEGRGAGNEWKSIPAHLRRRRNSLATPETSAPTDRHLSAILTNPLFSHGAEKTGSGSPSRRDPMDVFDEACSKGLMTNEYARACLKVKKNLIIQSSILDVREGLQKSKAGSKVLKWLVSSGATEEVAFLQDEVFSAILIEFLAAENLQEVVWAWFEKSLLPDADPSLQSDLIPASLLRHLVKAEASSAVSLDAAYTSFVRATVLLQKHPRSGRRILYRPGRFLSVESTTSSSSHLPASPSKFEEFSNTVTLFSRVPRLQLAHLNLYHPTMPDATLALQVLREAKVAFSPAFVADEPTFRKFRKRVPEWQIIINIGLDTAKHLLERNEYATARWVMDFLQQAFPKQLGVNEEKQIELAKAEAWSLELLHGLKLV